MKIRSCLFLGLIAATASVAAEHYQLTAPIPLPGDGGWDYMTADVAGRRLYVTHSKRVQVVDLDSGALVGEVAPTPGVHGVAIASETGSGFTSNGADSTVTMFDLHTLAVTQTLKITGSKPDAILYDPFTRRVFTFNGGSDNCSAFDAASGKALGTVELPGGPESAASDGAGHCYVNLEEQAEVVRFDPKSLEVTARWPLAPGKTATALAVDAANHRLLAGCRSKNLIVLDADTGAKVADLPIGGGVDAIALDAEHHRAFVACSEGVVNVVSWTDANHYEVSATIKTQPGARTIAYDSQRQRAYLSAAKFGPAPAPTEAVPRPRPTILPGSFELLVIEAEHD